MFVSDSRSCQSSYSDWTVLRKWGVGRADKQRKMTLFLCVFVTVRLMMSSALKRVFLWGLTWSLSVFAARRPCTPPHTWSLELGEMFKSCYLVVSCLKSPRMNLLQCKESDEHTHKHCLSMSGDTRRMETRQTTGYLSSIRDFRTGLRWDLCCCVLSLD